MKRMIQIWSGVLMLATFIAPSVRAANVDTILGTIDGVVDDGSGAVVVRGWACWKGWSGTSPQVDLYVGGGRDGGGIKIGTYSTGQPSEQAISDVCETSDTAHRFVINLTISLRQQYPGKSIYIYGMPYPGLSNYTRLSGSGQYTVPSAPAVVNSVYYIHTDRLGSNVIMTDANASVVAKTNYKAYGQAEQQGSKQEAPGYTGGYEDPLTGLTYMQARYYDADLGRFISMDPMQATAGDIYDFNRYAYANNNPMSFTDPDGQSAKQLDGYSVSANVYSSGTPVFWSNNGAGRTGGGGGIPGGGGGASASSAAMLPTVNVTANVVAVPTPKPIELPQIRIRAVAPPNPWLVLVGSLIWPSNGLGNAGVCPPNCYGALPIQYAEEFPVPGVTPDRVTKGNTKIGEKPGDAGTASGDFDGLNPDNVQDKGNGIRVGTLGDGSTVIVRPNSSDGRPTIEIQRGGRTRIKIRYGN
jgi:RHS repeat-associated protein